MASVEQIALSDFIKSVHNKLREKSKTVGVEEAWKDHCTNEENLKKYASAMKELATNYWEQNDKSESNILSRIAWTCATCRNYFDNEIIKHRQKEKDVVNKIGCQMFIEDIFTENHSNQLLLLDVGSCYNPFQKFEYLNVTAIDIAPALHDVFRCDFLNVKVDDSLITHNKDLLQLPRNYYDIVVFSLLLEYFPSPKQRYACCEKAYDLLKTEGILIIITPDSNHIGTNAKIIKSWQFVLAEIGFSRVKYEKLPHIHCMAFRKSFCKEITKRWAKLYKKDQVYNEIFIPQDFKVLSKDKKSNALVGDEYLTENFIQFMDELPKCDIFQ